MKAVPTATTIRASVKSNRPCARATRGSNISSRYGNSPSGINIRGGAAKGSKNKGKYGIASQTCKAVNADVPADDHLGIDMRDANEHGDFESMLDVDDVSEEDVRTAQTYRKYVRAEGAKARLHMEQERIRAEAAEASAKAAAAAREQARIKAEAALERAVTTVLASALSPSVPRLHSGARSGSIELATSQESSSIDSSKVAATRCSVSCTRTNAASVCHGELTASPSQAISRRRRQHISSFHTSPRNVQSRIEVLARPRGFTSHAQSQDSSAHASHQQARPDIVGDAPIPELDLTPSITRRGKRSTKLPTPVPTWRAVQQRVLQRQHMLWDQTVRVAPELRSALGFDEMEARIQQEKRELLDRLERPLETFVQQLPGGEDLDLSVKLARSNICSLRDLSKFRNAIDLRLALQIKIDEAAAAGEGGSKEYSCDKRITETLTNAILSARRALALATVDGLYLEEDEDRLAGAEAAVDAAMAHVESVKTDEKLEKERIKREKRSETIRHQMMEELKRLTSKAIDLLTEWDEDQDGNVDQFEMLKVMQTFGFTDATQADADFVFAQLDADDSGKIDYKELSAIMRRMQAEYSNSGKVERKRLGRRNHSPAHTADEEEKPSERMLEALEARKAAERALESMRHSPGPLRKSLFLTTERWHDYLATDLDLGAHLVSDEKAGPTWRETVKWARWMLSTKFADETDPAKYFAMTKAQVDRCLEHIQLFLWRAFYPGFVQSLEAGEQRLYWTRVSRLYDNLFTDRSRYNWAGIAISGARAGAVLNGKSQDEQRAAASQALAEVSSMLHKGSSSADLTSVVNLHGEQKSDRGQSDDIQSKHAASPDAVVSAVTIFSSPDVKLTTSKATSGKLGHSPVRQRWNMVANHVRDAEVALLSRATEEAAAAAQAAAVRKRADERWARVKAQMLAAREAKYRKAQDEPDEATLRLSEDQSDENDDNDEIIVTFSEQPDGHALATTLAWSYKDVANAVCNVLVMEGRLKSTPPSVRTDRENRLTKFFETAALDGPKLASSTVKEIEGLVRRATCGETWVDDVQHALRSMMGQPDEKKSSNRE